MNDLRDLIPKLADEFGLTLTVSPDGRFSELKNLEGLLIAPIQGTNDPQIINRSYSGYLVGPKGPVHLGFAYESDGDETVPRISQSTDFTELDFIGKVFVRIYPRQELMPRKRYEFVPITELPKLKEKYHF